jgi:hypothetical protein
MAPRPRGTICCTAPVGIGDGTGDHLDADPVEFGSQVAQPVLAARDERDAMPIPGEAPVTMAVVVGDGFGRDMPRT